MELMKIDQRAFLVSLKSALLCASKQDCRYYLVGVLIERQGHSGVNIVSTDGHRLFRVRVMAEMTDGWPDQMILDRDSVAALLKAAKPEKAHKADFDEWARLCLTDDKVTFEHGNTLARLEIVEGKFPDYHRVIPDYRNMGTASDKAGRVGVNAKYLADACKALEPFAIAPRTPAVAFYPPADANSSFVVECEPVEIQYMIPAIVVLMPCRL